MYVLHVLAWSSVTGSRMRRGRHKQSLTMNRSDYGCTHSTYFRSNIVTHASSGALAPPKAYRPPSQESPET